MAIPKKTEDVGYNQATVSMDVDALTREAMIRLFSLVDDVGEPLGEYDEAYLDKMETNTGLNPDDSGAASLVKQFILLEGKILGFLFQQFLSMVKPIQTALELPKLLTNPPQLIQKIKDIIEGIKDLIEDVVTFFTDTLNWFLGLLLGEIMDVNIPIPPLEFSILGITIPIPSIDTLGKIGKEPYIENLTDNVKGLKDKIETSRSKIQNLTDKINPNIEAYQVGMVALLTEQIIKLISVDYQLTNEFWDKAYQIHEEVLLKKDKIVRDKLNDKQEENYKFVNRTDELDAMKKYLEDNAEEKNYIFNYTGNETTLLNMADSILEILEKEEKEIEDTVNNYKMESNSDLKTKFDALDVILNEYTEELLILKNDLSETSSDIDDSKENRQKIYDNERAMLMAGGATAAVATIKALRDSIKEDTAKIAEESPASAYAEAIKDLIIGVIKSPIDMIINIISKIIEGIVEFITELPIPTFTKIKEFFSDIIGLANPEKMEEIISAMIIDITGAGEQFLPVVENVVSFLPWLFVEIAKTFITSVVEPLPIPI